MSTTRGSAPAQNESDNGTDHAYRQQNPVLGEVWGYSAGLTTHTLETHMCRLRQKIESDPFDPKILITKPGGYQLVC